MAEPDGPAGATSDPPFVTVVVPVLNNVSGIDAALESLLEQTYPEARFEVIIVDNGSADATPDVVRSYAARHPARIRLVTEHRPGSYAARNAGIREARGSVLAFTDSDCVPDPDWLERGVAALEDHDAGYAAGRVVTTFRGTEPNIWEYYDAVGKLNQRLYMERYDFGATANLFALRDHLARHGPFRGELESGGDYELGRRLAQAGESGIYVDDAVVRHPARATARAVLAKERRIVRGREQLAAAGLLEHGRLGWRSFVPVRRPPSSGEYGPPGRKLAFLVVANAVRYYTLILRLAARWAPAWLRERLLGPSKEAPTAAREGAVTPEHDVV